MNNNKTSISDSETRNSYVIQSLARGLAVLRCFTPETPVLSLKSIAEELGLPKGSAYRVVATLEELGYVRQEKHSKQYRLTLRALDLGFSCLAGLEFPNVAVPYLEALANEAQQSASMAVLEGTEIVYVARASIRSVMTVNLGVGSRLPAFCTSMGRVLLAYTADDELEQLLDRVEFRVFTPYTVQTRKRLMDELHEVRSRGYAINDRELEIELRSAAAPVRDASGDIVAAINVSMFATKMSHHEIMNRIIPTLVETAQGISSALGYRPGVSRYRRKS